MNIHQPHPEHELVDLALKARYCLSEGEFLAWLIEVKGYALAEHLPSTAQLVPAMYTLEKLLAEYHGIDLDQVAAKRRELLRETKGKS